MAHRSFHVVLSEVHIQRKIKDLHIGKKTFSNELALEGPLDEVCKEIDKALDVLKIISFKMSGYKFAGSKKKKLVRSAKTAGNLITNVTETPEEFVFDLNPHFVGCISFLVRNSAVNWIWNGNKKSLEEGYFDFSLKMLAETGGYSEPASLLARFLQKASTYFGVKKEGLKPIHHRVRRFVEEMNLTHFTQGRRYKTFCNALGEAETIVSLTPSSQELKKLTPERGLKKKLTIWVPGTSEDLEKTIHRIIANRA